MNSTKRNIIILTILLLLLPTIIIFQYKNIGKKNRQYTVDINMQNLQEEIDIIRRVSQEVLSTFKIDTTGLANTANISAEMHSKTTRDPFVFPEDIAKARAEALAAIKKTQVVPKAEKPKPPEPKPVIKLAGIIFDIKNPMAIINGDIYKVSDKIAEYTVSSISEKGVRLVSSKEILFLDAPVIE